MTLQKTLQDKSFMKLCVYFSLVYYLLFHYGEFITGENQFPPLIVIHNRKKLERAQYENED